MKKGLALFVALVLCAGFSANVNAKDDPIGLTVALEYFFENANKKDVDGDYDAEGDDDTYTYMIPYIFYENSFLDGALDIYAELDYTMGLKQRNEDGNENDDKVYGQYLYLDLIAGYNLSLGSTSALSFLLENKNEFAVSPINEDLSNADGLLKPGVKFTKGLFLGDLYGQVDVPFTYTQMWEEKDIDKVVGLDFTIGWSYTFSPPLAPALTTGLELKEKNILKTGDEDNKGYAGFEIKLYSEAGPIYAELKIEIPKKADEGKLNRFNLFGNPGVKITPEIDFSFDIFTFYFYCEIDYIGVEKVVPMVSPALGLQISF